MAKPYVRAGGQHIVIEHDWHSVTGLRMKVHGKVRFTLHTEHLRAAFQGAARQAAEEAGKLILEKARHNVSPGVGPGPHPHISKHIDTGDLMRSLFLRISEGPAATGPGTALAWRRPGGGAQMIKAEVGHPAETFYGSLLELGWHTSTGRFVRYPWLMPAIEATKSQMTTLIWRTMRGGIMMARVPTGLAAAHGVA